MVHVINIVFLVENALVKVRMIRLSDFAISDKLLKIYLGDFK
jgi:hypothetical protein